MTIKNFITKSCSVCNETKELCSFNKSISTKDGLFHRCKKCLKKYRDEYNKTKKGVATKIYGNQIGNSKNRNHPAPNYTKKDFSIWLFYHPEFHLLYDLWEESGYKAGLKPSCDRKNDYLPYSLSNMQLMTWQENKEKGSRDRVNGVNRKTLKAVNQLNLEGKRINEYYSISCAGRTLSINASHISECCLGGRKTAGGFRWNHVDE